MIIRRTKLKLGVDYGTSCLTEKRIGAIASVFLCYAIVMLRLCNVGVYDERLHHNMTAGKVPAPFQNPGFRRGFLYGRLSQHDVYVYIYILGFLSFFCQ